MSHFQDSLAQVDCHTEQTPASPVSMRTLPPHTWACSHCCGPEAPAPLTYSEHPLFHLVKISKMFPGTQACTQGAGASGSNTGCGSGPGMGPRILSLASCQCCRCWQLIGYLRPRCLVAFGRSAPAGVTFSITPIAWTGLTHPYCVSVLFPVTKHLISKERFISAYYSRIEFTMVGKASAVSPILVGVWIPYTLVEREVKSSQAEGPGIHL